MGEDSRVMAPPTASKTGSQRSRYFARNKSTKSRRSKPKKIESMQAAVNQMVKDADAAADKLNRRLEMVIKLFVAARTTAQD